MAQTFLRSRKAYGAYTCFPLCWPIRLRWPVAQRCERAAERLRPTALRWPPRAGHIVESGLHQRKHRVLVLSHLGPQWPGYRATVNRVPGVNTPRLWTVQTDGCELAIAARRPPHPCCPHAMCSLHAPCR